MLYEPQYEGADISAKDGSGDMPVHVLRKSNAYQQGRGSKQWGDCAKLETALLPMDIFHASRAGNWNKLHYLLHSKRCGTFPGAVAKAVNAQDDDGMTPLHHAVDAGRRDIAEFLIENGADIHSVDKRNRTPFQVALIVQTQPK